MPSARAIAYYLPQYHPVPENDEWWGKGFTEWTNTAKARPLFSGHYQPHVPTELGFCDLRVPETREAQAQLAREHGIEAFCYYHYWFGHGRRLLERPFEEVLASGKPDLPFCLCWANETWTGVWHGATNRVLVRQNYPGVADEEHHFATLLPAFRDPRYVTVEGKPLFLVYSPHELPDPVGFTTRWRRLAARAGLPGLYLLGVQNEPWSPEDNGFDGATVRNLHRAYVLDGGEWSTRIRHHVRRLQGRPKRFYRYADALRRFASEECRQPHKHPCAIPNWDNTPRSGLRGLVLHDSTPELFRTHLRTLLAQIATKPAEHRLLFVKSWNEWAEGNHLEPDLRFGRAYLEVLRDELGSQAFHSAVLRTSADSSHPHLTPQVARP
ncbi:MAG: glycoside hydrolase family 99-like domain-containing protein [Verrucomicrobiota bacterium]